MTGGFSRRDLAPLAASLVATVSPVGTSERASAAPLTDSPGGIILDVGVHRVDTNTTIKTDLLLLPGAQIAVAAGRTLTVLGHFAAPIASVFVGQGNVDLNSSWTPIAYPEWWGAVTGDPTVDCLSALTACLAAHPVMHLRAADYFISDTWVVERGFCRIYGSGFRGTLAGRGTRIVVTSGRADVMRVGPATVPGPVNAFLQNVDLRGFNLSRSQPVDADDGQLPVGLRAQYLLYANFEDISAFEHAVGFHCKGLVRSQLRNCVAFRSFRGRQADTIFRGFLLDGTDDIGLAGGNGSIFLIDCNASIGGQPGVLDPVGLLLDAAFADSYIVNLEVSGIATGIRVNGQAKRLGGRAISGHVNLHLRMPIIDQCGRVGIELLETSPYAQIEISEPYVATAPGARTALHCEHLCGATTITGGQLLGGFNSDHGGTAAGLLASDSEGLLIRGLKIADHRLPLIFERCRNAVVQGLITNPRTTTSQAAATFTNCEGITVALHVTGKVAAFPQAVALQEATRRIEISATGLDGNALTGRDNARIVMNGRPLTVPSRTAEVVINGI